jgi:hypothetical protein
MEGPENFRPAGAIIVYTVEAPPEAAVVIAFSRKHTREHLATCEDNSHVVAGGMFHEIPFPNLTIDEMTTEILQDYE